MDACFEFQETYFISIALPEKQPIERRLDVNRLSFNSEPEKPRFLEKVVFWVFRFFRF